MAVRAATATRAKATRIVEPATVDLFVGAADGEAGMQRVDIEVTPAADGGLAVHIDLPASLGAKGRAGST